MLEGGGVGGTCISKEIEMEVTFRGVKNWVPSGTASEKPLGSFPPLFAVCQVLLLFPFPPDSCVTACG